MRTVSRILSATLVAWVTIWPVYAQEPTESLTATADSLTIQPGSVSLADCQTWCDVEKPDYRCYIAGSLNPDSGKQLRGLVQKLTGPQPIVLSHVDLLQIFGLEHSGYENARNATNINGGWLDNTGSPSVISTATVSNLVVKIIVPKQIRYAYSAAADGFNLVEQTADDSFFLQIGDDLLHYYYGGRVRGISVQPFFQVMTMDRGCLAYNTSPDFTPVQAAMTYLANLTNRLKGEARAGATGEKLMSIIGAYSRATLISRDPCTIEECEQNCGVNEVLCVTSLGNTCLALDACINSGGHMCGNQ